MYTLQQQILWERNTLNKQTKIKENIFTIEKLAISLQESIEDDKELSNSNALIISDLP